VSPTYVSKVERDELPPPAESRVKATAALLGIDADELLALAGKVSSDLAEIIRERPVTMASILRTARSVPEDTLRAMEKRLRDSNHGSSGALKNAIGHRQQSLRAEEDAGQGLDYD
jgi:transcriptional regulator with XRE-family HTH domain